MKRLIVCVLAAALLTANSARAGAFPAGCFVADYYRTDACWGEDVDYFSWGNFDYSNPQATNDYYGAAVATLLNQETLYRLNYNKLAAQSAKDKKLIKKLKAKCGSGCRSIK